jgi:hypothetical protein
MIFYDPLGKESASQRTVYADMTLAGSARGSDLPAEQFAGTAQLEERLNLVAFRARGGPCIQRSKSRSLASTSFVGSTTDRCAQFIPRLAAEARTLACSISGRSDWEPLSVDLSSAV